jgi:hypothetical protein
MTSLRLAALLFVLLPGSAAIAQESGPTAGPEVDPTTITAVVAKPTAASLPAIGIMADAGIPDGMVGSLVFRPKSWVRLHGGGSYNMISSGLRAGATWLPLGSGPSLSVEGGHYFDGDANGLVRKFAGPSYSSNAVLDRVGYDYANAHLGLDFGSRRVTFYIHGGMSYIRTTVHHLDDVVGTQGSGDPSSGTQVSIKQDPTIRAFTPSAKLGLIVYLW